MRRFLSVSSIVIALAVVASLAACNSREVAKVLPQPSKQDGPKVPVEINRNIDILFVIDNSGSMEEEQTSLTANFPGFIDVLKKIEGGLPNVRLGVITTDVGARNGVANCRGDGENGTLQSTGEDCPGPDDAYIEDLADDTGARIKNYAGTLEDTFSCIATLGTGGCGFEQPLEAMYRALNGSNPTNEGFLRDDAFLAVIIITDEDDCSTENNVMFDNSAAVEQELGPLSSFRCFEFGVRCEPDNNPRATGPRQNCQPRVGSEYMYDVDRYVQFLKRQLNKDPADIIVAGIFGNSGPVRVGIDNTGSSPKPGLEPSCETNNGQAFPGIRLQHFLEQFPGRNTFTTICNEDLSSALVLIAQLLAEVIGNPCIKGDIDTDPDTEGIQDECVVSDVNSFASTELKLSKCDPNVPIADQIPCWRLEKDPETCPASQFPTELVLIVERGSQNVPSGTVVEASCVVQ
ncbi:MAG: hypothetical protein MJE77_24650 [Proteobacteria bacterium]|nr:hypothetical protein [Pseudomonadota bacterium]